jgi:DNA-binding GntR family transcriptional regulator
MEQGQEQENSFETNSSISQASESDGENAMVINPETNEIEKMDNEESLDDEDYTPVTYSKNLNKTDDRIICVELKNNNKVYIQYHDTWTISQVSLLG